MLIALGAAARIGFDWLAVSLPTPVYGVVVKVGFSETLAITSGLVFGPVQGFLVGGLIIVVSDLYIAPGPWTPFIAGIIGLLGVFGGLLRGRVWSAPGSLAAVAVAATLLSELLQNTWVSLFYNIPLVATMATGIPSLLTALINNTILLTTIGPKIIRVLRERVVRPMVEEARHD